MAIPKQPTLAENSILTSLVMNRIQEMLSPMSINLELSISSATQITLTCGAGDAACVVVINGKMSWSESSKTVTVSGGAGTKAIYAVGTGSESDPSFTLSVIPQGNPAPGGNSRLVGTVAWSGSFLSDLRQIAGYEKHAFMHVPGVDPLPDGSVTPSMLSDGTGMLVVPTGTILDFAGTTPPTGYLLCDGASYAKATYPALWAVLNGAGWGSTTPNFNVPDLRGRVGVGVGQGSGMTLRQSGQVGGAEWVILDIGQIPSHNHGGTTGNNPSLNHNHGGATGSMNRNNPHGHNQSYPLPNFNNIVVNGGSAFPVNSGTVPGGSIIPTDINHEHAISGSGDLLHNHSIPSQGGGGTHENMPPFAVVTKIIKT